jgi:CBS domain-containing protein
MKIKDVMTSNAQVCTPETNLATAAMIMWENDCGSVPVRHKDCKVIGMITDRDICMAVATKHRLASEITVGEVFSGKLYVCHPNDDVRDALKIMKAEKVRRLPVISAIGTLEGIVSIDDIVRHAEDARGRKMPELSYEDVVNALKQICARRPQTGSGMTTSLQGGETRPQSGTSFSS